VEGSCSKLEFKIVRKFVVSKLWNSKKYCVELLPIRTIDILKIWFLEKIRKSDSQKFGIRKFGIRTSNVDPEGSYLKNYLSFDVRQTIQSDDKGRGF
jgi:hypothetical protein